MIVKRRGVVKGAAVSTNGVGPMATLDLEQLVHRVPRVAINPGPTLFTIAADLVGAGRGSPNEWLRAARAELAPSDFAILRPISARSGEFTPGRVNGALEGDIREVLEQIATLPIEDLLEDIAFTYGSSPPPPWSTVARQPRRWLVLYARALGRVWRGIREPWSAAAPLIEREAERVATAAERGALPELMSGVHHRARVRDGVWLLEDVERRELQVPEAGLTMTPVLGGPGAGRARYNDDGVLKGIIYPLPGAIRVLDGEVLPPAAALEVLLGNQRTTILRMLDQPRAAGRLAEAMVATPGAATHHLKAMEGAGLVVRERAGRTVVVHRTKRGDALLGLYDGA